MVLTTHHCIALIMIVLNCDENTSLYCLNVDVCLNVMTAQEYE